MKFRIRTARHEGGYVAVTVFGATDFVSAGSLVFKEREWDVFLKALKYGAEAAGLTLEMTEMIEVSR